MNAHRFLRPILLLVLLVCAGSSAAEIFMSKPITVANPGGPIRARLPDLNGDGIADLVVLNNVSATVNVYIGKGGGAAHAPVSYPVGAGPTELIVLDINNDGKLDLVTLNTGGNSISVLRGNGDGTFAPAETIPVGINPTRLDVFKANNGFGRIVTANTGSDSISFLAVQPNGAFAAAVNFPVGKAPNFVLRSDLDGDGQAEFIVSNGGDDTISVVTRNAAGVPVGSVSYPVGKNPTWIATGDGNGDGKRDIVVANTGSDTMSVLFGNGDKTLQPAFNLPTGPSPRHIITADLDGDTITDAIIRNGDGTYTVYVSSNPGVPTAYDGGGASSNTGYDLVDYDGDGIPDIVGVVTGDNKLAILPGRANGTFGQARTFAAGPAPGPRFGENDIDGDGRLDIAVVNTAADTVTVLLQVASPPVLGTVTEFYNTILDNYFITADPNEAAAIDSGSAGPGWSRTGANFNFSSGGNTYVCRFYGSISPGPNSHFYTASASECGGLKSLQQTTPATSPRWNFESLDFVTTNPAAGSCPAGTKPVYRAYNNGFNRHVDSNHRITGDPAGIAAVVARGWISEGTVMCSPS